MNLDILTRQIITAYLNNKDRLEWDVRDHVQVICYFAARRFELFGIETHLKTDTLAGIMYTLENDFHTEYENGEVITSGCRRFPGEYRDLIEKYFATDFSAACDYSISHFLSGAIRSITDARISKEGV